MKRKYLAKDKLYALKKDFPSEMDFDDTLEKPALIILKQQVFVEIMHILKIRYKFDMLSNITAVDYADHFEVVYDLANRTNNEELMVKIALAKTDTNIPTLTKLWPEADFQEREQYDLMGINFLGHPNLQRILLPDDFIGHPLQKSYKQVEKGGISEK